MTDDEAREMIAEYWNAFANKDIPKAMTFFADDATYEDKAIEHVATCKADIAALWSQYFDAASEGFDATLSSSLVTGDGYAWGWTVKGKIDGAFGALQGTGQLVTMEGASLGQLRDGKIIKHTDYWNLGSVVRQIEGSDASAPG